jgi:thiosulfate/3-mercaptopyruvate sulfurtransferase
MRQKLLAIVIGVCLVLVGAPVLAGGTHTTGPDWMTNSNPPYKGFVRGWALISAKELHELWVAQQAWNNHDSIEGNHSPAKDPKLVIIDVGKPKLHYVAEGHIPGAFNTWRSDYESPEKLFGIRGENLMSRENFQHFLRSFGIDNDSQVVFYDHKYDATRLWWACKYYGFNVRVLDGGFKAWKDAGYEVDRLSSPEKPSKPGNLVLPGSAAMPTLRVEADAVWKCKDNPMWDLWDIRSMKEITGQRKRAKRMGKIPWQRALVTWKQFHRKDKTWKDAAELQAMLDKFGFDPSHHHVFYCQSGVRTTQAIFSLYLMGYPLEHLHNFDGSWIYWGNAPDTPIVDQDGKPVPYKD